MIKIVARHYRVQPARRASSQQIYERRVLNPDNNHLSGTIARCINRVLSPDTNDKRRSVSLLSLSHARATRYYRRSFYRSHSRPSNGSDYKHSPPPPFFFKRSIRQASNLSIDLSGKKIFPSQVSLPLRSFIRFARNIISVSSLFAATELSITRPRNIYKYCIFFFYIYIFISFLMQPVFGDGLIIARVQGI